MVKVDNENEATARLEAALYSAGRPLSIEAVSYTHLTLPTNREV